MPNDLNLVFNIREALDALVSNTPKKGDTILKKLLNPLFLVAEGISIMEPYGSMWSCKAPSLNKNIIRNMTWQLRVRNSSNSHCHIIFHLTILTLIQVHWEACPAGLYFHIFSRT